MCRPWFSWERDEGGRERPAAGESSGGAAREAALRRGLRLDDGHVDALAREPREGLVHVRPAVEAEPLEMRVRDQAFEAGLLRLLRRVLEVDRELPHLLHEVARLGLVLLRGPLVVEIAGGLVDDDGGFLHALQQ